MIPWPPACPLHCLPLGTPALASPCPPEVRRRTRTCPGHTGANAGTHRRLPPGALAAPGSAPGGGLALASLSPACVLSAAGGRPPRPAGPPSSARPSPRCSTRPPAHPQGQAFPLGGLGPLPPRPPCWDQASGAALLLPVPLDTPRKGPKARAGGAGVCTWGVTQVPAGRPRSGCHPEGGVQAGSGSLQAIWRLRCQGPLGPQPCRGSHGGPSPGPCCTYSSSATLTKRPERSLPRPPEVPSPGLEPLPGRPHSRAAPPPGPPVPAEGLGGPQVPL